MLVIAHLNDRIASQLGDLLAEQPRGAGSLHGIHHPIEYLVDDEHFLLGDAQQVVVVRCTLDDRTCGTVKIRCLVDHHRRIARSGHDRSFATVQGGAGDTGTAGHTDQLHVAMLENDVCRLQRRFRDDADQIVDPHITMDGLVESAHAFGRHSFSAGVRIDDQAVAGRNHVHRVARDCGQRVGDGRDRPDHAKRCVFDDGQAVITTEDLALHEFDTR